MKPTLLIVDKDEELHAQAKWALAADFDIVVAEDRITALESFRRVRPLVILLNLGLFSQPNYPDEGLALLSEVVALDKLAKIIIVSRQMEKSIDLGAIGVGASGFLIKPIETAELKILVQNFFYVANLEREYHQMQQLSDGDAFGGMIGSSTAIRNVFDSIRKVASSDVPVLLSGEGGTGKGAAARAIHQTSNRKERPFVAINCGAIPEAVLYRELFGYEKDSFPGAQAQGQGKFDLARGGTIFLNEIAEISLGVQSQLLRVVEDQCFDRFGGRAPIKIDVRIIAATNLDLKKGMRDGTFREDLYYRLSVVHIVLPPLRERERDIRSLGQFFLKQFGRQANKNDLSFDQDALRAMDRYPWPGNVRQLENCVRRAVIMCYGNRITVRDLELAPVGEKASTNFKEAREKFEREMIERTFRRHSGKIAPAAAELGISRPTLYDLMQKLGISKD